MLLNEKRKGREEEEGKETREEERREGKKIEKEKEEEGREGGQRESLPWMQPLSGGGLNTTSLRP